MYLCTVYACVYVYQVNEIQYMCVNVYMRNAYLYMQYSYVMYKTYIVNDIYKCVCACMHAFWANITEKCFAHTYY